MYRLSSATELIVAFLHPFGQILTFTIPDTLILQTSWCIMINVVFGWGEEENTEVTVQLDFKNSHTHVIQCSGSCSAPCVIP